MLAEDTSGQQDASAKVVMFCEAFRGEEQMLASDYMLLQ